MRRPMVFITLVYIAMIMIAHFVFGIDLKTSEALTGLAGEKVTVEGTLMSIEEKDEDYFRSMVEVERIDSAGKLKKPEPLLISLYGSFDQNSDSFDKNQGGKSIDHMVGEKVRVQVKIELPKERRNPKTFDYRLYLKTKGIFAVGSCKTEDFSVTDEERASFTHHIWVKRTSFIKDLRKVTDQETASMVAAMIFGDKSRMEEDIYEAFQKNGIAHILAVSGLHMGILYGFFSLLWRWKKGLIFSLFAIVFLFIFAAMAQFSPSVVRAVIMIGLHIFAKLIHRPYDLLSAAAFTAFVMLLANPMQLFNPGFQLSFGAVTVLAMLIPFFQRGIKGKLLTVFGLQIFMALFIAYHFNYFSLSSFLLNFPAMWIAGLMIPLGVVLQFFNFIGFFEIFFQTGAFFLQKAVQIMVYVNDFMYRPGIFTFDVTSPPLWLLWIFYGVFFLTTAEFFRIFFLRKKRSAICSVLIILISITFCVDRITDDGFDNAEIVFVDVGQGDCILLSTKKDRHYLFDGGGNVNYDVGKELLKPYLLKNGIRKIDIAFVTHLHTDHYEGIKSLAKEGMIKYLCVYDGNRVIEEKILKETGMAPQNILYGYKGNEIDLDKDTKVEILWPEKKSYSLYEEMTADKEDENAMSMIMKINHGPVSILVTGDIDEEGEKTLIEKYGKNLRADIMKVPHHGSKYSSSDRFIESVDPKAAVFQVGKNNYGHPAGQVVEKYQKQGIMICRNDLQGAVGLFCGKDGTLQIKTMIGGE